MSVVVLGGSSWLATLLDSVAREISFSAPLTGLMGSPAQALSIARVKSRDLQL